MSNDLGALIEWSRRYNAAWDTTPSAYLTSGLLPPGRSRRLGRIEEPCRRFKAYIGVQHQQAGVWNDTDRVVFWASFWRAGRVVTLRTYPTMPATLEALEQFRLAL